MTPSAGLPDRHWYDFFSFPMPPGLVLVLVETPLPPIRASEVRAVADYLLSLEHAQRRPVLTAGLLVLVVKLYRHGVPWPLRSEVAKHVGISLPMVDTAIRRCEKDLKIITQRPLSVTQKLVVPCAELIRVVEEAA